MSVEKIKKQIYIFVEIFCAINCFIPNVIASSDS